MTDEQSDQLISDKVHELTVGPVDRWRSPSTRWSDHLDDDPAYKYVERVVHDVKIYELRRRISNGDEIAYAARRSVGVKMYLYLI